LCFIAFSVHVSLHTLHHVPHTQVLARCNLKGSHLMSVLGIPHWWTDEVGNNVSKRILSCLGSMWCC